MSISSKPIASLSAPALRRVHMQRLVAFALFVTVCTMVVMEVMMSSWTFRVGPGRILNDFLSLMVRAEYVCAHFVPLSL